MKTRWLVLAIISSLSSAVFAADAVLQFTHGILVDKSGRTVYLYDEDTSSLSSCYGRCAHAWPPVFAPEGSEPLPDGVAVTPRTDGTRQLTYHGKPVYYYIGDTAPGDENGDGLGGVWHVIPQNH